ncbi:MAG: hypothetical protein AAF206_17245, partial [Bacteroidota bacterium]
MPDISSVGKIINLLKPFAKKKWEALKEHDQRVIYLHQKLNIPLQIGDSFESVYAHSLIAYGASEQSHQDILTLFSQEDVIGSFQDFFRRKITAEALSSLLLDRINIDPHLHPVHIQSIADLQPEVAFFVSILKEKVDLSRSPKELEMYHTLLSQKEEMVNILGPIEEKLDRLVAETEKTTFDYQIKKYLQARYDAFQEEKLADGKFIPIHGETVEEDSLFSEKMIRDAQGREKPFNIKKKGKKQQHKPIDQFVSNWLDQTNQSFLVIVGEYGTGKTTFSQYLTHQLA